MLSLDIVDCSDFWLINSVDSPCEGFVWATLEKRLNYVNKVQPYLELTETTLKPTREKKKRNFLNWNCAPYALFFDTCFAYKLVSRADLDSDYEVADAFYNALFMGWEVKFFTTLEEVEGFIKEHKEFSHFRLFKGYERLPFKFVCDKDKKVILGSDIALYKDWSIEVWEG